MVPAAIAVVASGLTATAAEIKATGVLVSATCAGIAAIISATMANNQNGKFTNNKK